MILTDEEILAIQNEYTEESRAIWGGAFARDEKTELAFALASVPSRVAKAQLKKIVEYLYGKCTNHGWHPDTIRIDCDECRQSLLDEVKEA